MDSTRLYFVTDLHGKRSRYEKLFALLEENPPDVLLIGGDFLPSHGHFEGGMEAFIGQYLFEHLSRLKTSLRRKYPLMGLIFGNDDPAAYIQSVKDLEEHELLTHLHNTSVSVGRYSIYGYAYVPPTPFRLKDWERYDVSRYTDPGCVAPEEGVFSANPKEDILYYTITQGLEDLTKKKDLSSSVFLFHSPPYQTVLDRAALDGQSVDHVPLDVHVGSIAIRRFIENRQPLATFHGHIHESARLTGHWYEFIGNTFMCNAATEGDQLALIHMDLINPSKAERIIL
jgi:uncharacterized protein